MAVREIAVPWDIQPPPGTQVNWNNDLANQADYIATPLTGELSAKAGSSDRFVSLSSGLLVPRSLGTAFGKSGGTSDGHSTVSNFTAISGATSLSLFVVLQCTTTTGSILGRWGTTANWGGLLLTFESNALVTVIAPGASAPTWYAKRTGALSAGTILYGCTWYGANSQDNYINGVVNNGTTWFTGSPAAIQTASEKLYLNRNADAASGSGNSSVLFAAIGINKKWTASTHAQWAASYNEVYEPRRIWVPVAAAGATFKPAWARGCNTVISSGARP